MSGTSLPSSSICAFHEVTDPSSSDGSCPRPSSRTGFSDSGETRYWYQEISQATVTTTSELTPDSTTTETCGVPSDLPMPPTVRRYWDALKRSAALTIACSWSESRRRIGSATIIFSSVVRGRVPRIGGSQPPPRRLRSVVTIGVVGAPSRSHPYSIAASAQSGQTSTKLLPPFGENRIAFSPIRSVRSQIAHERSTAARVTRVMTEG